ncbi:oxidoreductase [Aureibacillus halotolerans]|uniref:NAD(P)-dependent dehydrogenase (Short-subunit alcohol dehydrogenase family) n=1 Tax=Aureibacillus halotolerans TaxID=1508390 RepID=A0A4R6TRZ8_9BACI|nr:oxidoreductase [Aureibacillus halotolerans]TDQ36378.1 NAD(P)-dependent dehydrogenase (short-subunit alcohol dehydrogenase family) [Aureibacillus halotolerans]
MGHENNWRSVDIPSQRGRSAVVTGTGGLGYETALVLAGKGMDVILAGRNAAKGEAAANAIRNQVSSANIQFELLDLANLESVRAFGQRMSTSLQKLDVLINNAGVMSPPTRKTTNDGFELQFGTNYLGHFALTSHLMPLLRKGKDPVVVTLSSVAARQGVIDFNDLQATHHYKAMPVYRQSKLACLMFAFELHRRSVVASWGVRSIAAHPGISRTELMPNGAGKFSINGILRRAMWFMFQPAAQGALPTLYAATNPNAKDGGYYGPDKMNETRGFPKEAKMPEQSLDQKVANELWNLSEQLANVKY